MISLLGRDARSKLAEESLRERVARGAAQLGHSGAVEAARVDVDEKHVWRERLAEVERVLLEADDVRRGRLVDLPGGGAVGASRRETRLRRA